MFPPAVLAWEAFQKVTLIAPQVASEASKVLMVKSWTSVWDAIRSTPGASPPRLGGRTRGVGSRTPSPVRDLLALARERSLDGKSVSNPV